MPKKLSYLILSNTYLTENYKSNQLVFEEKNLQWNEVPQVSGYWNEFEYRNIYNYKTLMKKLKSVVDQTSSEPCDYNKERLFLFSNLYCQLKIGETLFVQYDGPEVVMDMDKVNCN
jgi:hypothetical protein